MAGAYGILFFCTWLSNFFQQRLLKSLYVSLITLGWNTVKNKVTMYVDYPWAAYCIPLAYVSVFTPAPY